MKPPPLFVDLDGTLISGDTLRLTLCSLMRVRPWTGLLIAPTLLGGRGAFKAAVARWHGPLDPVRLPWRESILGFLQGQRAIGRRLVLATAAHHSVAQAVAEHLKLFEAVIASDATNNLKGCRKVAAIHAFTGGGDFDYAGDSWADLPVFAAARRSIIVTRDQRLLAKASALGNVEAVFNE